MATLFVIDGAFGTSKSFLAEYLRSHSRRGTASVIEKYTCVKDDRMDFVNAEISVDLNVVTEENFDKLVSEEDCYYYALSPQRYAVPKKLLRDSLEKHPHVFVVVRDKQIIQSMKKEISDSDINVVSVYIYIDKLSLQTGIKQSKQNISDIELEQHLKRHRSTWDEYTHDISFYTHVLINNMDTDDFHRQIDTLIKLYSGK